MQALTNLKTLFTTLQTHQSDKEVIEFSLVIANQLFSLFFKRFSGSELHQEELLSTIAFSVQVLLSIIQVFNLLAVVLALLISDDHRCIML